MILPPFIPAPKGDWVFWRRGYKFALGCLLSHIEIIKDAKKNKYKRILILEDDVKLCSDFEVQVQNLRLINDWKLMYLGASQYSWADIEYFGKFYHAKRTSGTFAYALDYSVYDDLISNKDSNLTIDKILSKIQEKYYGKCFVCYPNIIIADVTSSLIRAPRDQTIHNEKMRWNILRFD